MFTEVLTLGKSVFFYSASDMEPGLALMDEIGRRALTNAFINFIRKPSDPRAYRDSLIYDQCRVTNVDETASRAAKRRSRVEEDDGDDLDGGGRRQSGAGGGGGIPKCPSAPDIAHHKLDPGVIMGMKGSKRHAQHPHQTHPHHQQQHQQLLGRAATVSGKRTPSPRGESGAVGGGSGGGGRRSRNK